MDDKKIGEISQYFHNISVAAIMLSDELKEGDQIHIKGATTDFKQKVKSMEIERESVEKGEKGQEIAIKVKDRVRENDEVFLVE
ncbi:MAG: translation elongation factor-like protein [Candidatus Lokiarchaeota archaeon]|nr:translation elongation factor-like protein [Candidatus Lokiarchaeota archaeon]